MATDNSENNGASGGGSAISPAVRKRLEQCYDRGVQNSTTGNVDYATELLSQSVVGDPSSQKYTQGLLANLHRKYNNNKKGGALAGIKTAGSKASMMNANRKKDWPGLIKAGLDVLKVNPWDVASLIQIAKACGELNYVESQLTYLKSAQDADPKSTEVNRECAKALEKIGQYDQAISCWSHVARHAKGGSEEADEANREIAKLQVEKTMMASGIPQEEGAEGEGDPAKFKARPAGMNPPAKRTKIQELEEQIAKNPKDILMYAELAETLIKAEKWSEAEGILSKGLEATGGDLRIREQLEDVQLRKARQMSLIADKRLAENKTTEAAELSQKMRGELLRMELDVFRKRVERYPTNTHWKYELAARLKQSGNFNESIKLFQEARNDPKHRGIVMLDLGECFQQIKQYSLAMQHYNKAIEEIPDKDQEHKKKSLYRAGVLAMGLEQFEVAEKHFSQLAASDYGYKDVSARLDKIAKLRDKGSSPAAG
ncbi:MAG TPA: tetratricopeptide repeat protein [Pirellulales bacterium]